MDRMKILEKASDHLDKASEHLDQAIEHARKSQQHARNAERLSLISLVFLFITLAAMVVAVFWR